jgi:CRISPR-associated endonuclease Cas2
MTTMAKAKPPGPIDHVERAKRVKKTGLSTRFFHEWGTGGLAILPLNERISRLLEYLHVHQPQNISDMTFFVMYDITDNKIRHHVAKYLQRKGCIRMQKSVFLGSGSTKMYKEINDTLRDINTLYHNEDSIMIFPVETDLVHQLSMIGKNVDFKFTVKPPSILII